MAVGEEWGSLSLVFENSILLIRVQGYRRLTEKFKTLKTVHTLRIEHGGLGVKRGALFKELYIYSCNYELFV